MDVSKHDEEDTYLPAFRAAVVEGHAGLMCAYNAINGQPACASDFLLEHTLRGAWHFQGYVVSDCGAIRDVANGHQYRPSQAEASAISLQHGMDNECADFFAKVTDDHDYRPYIEAVQKGYLAESVIDTALVRLFTARMRLGMFDPPEVVPYAKPDETQLDSATHRSLARRLANESMVLLKNDGVLPLKSPKHILVVGPLADQTAVLLGNYNGVPSHTVSVLEGIKAEFPGAKITYVPGTSFLSSQGSPVPGSLFTTPEGQPGVKAEYSAGQSLDAPSAVFATRVEQGVDLNGNDLPQEARGKSALSVQWTGTLHPTETGDYLLGIKATGSATVSVDGHQIVQLDSAGTSLGPVHLEAGHPVTVDVE